MIQTNLVKVKSLFFEAVGLTDAEREAFLRHLEVADAEISAQVRELLAEPADTGPDLSNACWAAPNDGTGPRILEIGQRLEDRFEVMEFRGAGGIGEVYSVWDHRQRTFSAIKTLRPGVVADHTALKMLGHELNTARQVTHPNVCRVFDIHGDSSKLLFFSMELLDGETLSKQLIREGPLLPEAAAPLVQQILAGLEAIHAEGIVHRDLKTNNIMLADGGKRAVVMDFGLARKMEGSADLPTALATGQFAGTPAYMAPELLRGGPATCATDIHALGVVLFEMVTGQRPFDGSTPVDAASKRLNQDAPSPRRFAPSLSRRWEYAILQCLEADPAYRPQSVEAVRQLLAQEPPLLWGNRRKVLVLAGVAAAGIGPSLFWITKPKARTVTLEVAEIGNRTGRRELDYVTKGTTGEVARRLSSVEHVHVLQLQATPVEQAGLGENHVRLEGELLLDGPTFRWNLRLIDLQTAKTAWSRSLPQKPGDTLLAVQSQIAKDVRARLQEYIAAPASAEAEVTSIPTQNGMALDYYMRGRHLLEEASPTSTRAAIEHLQLAIDADPNFALAWSAMGDAYLNLTNYESGSDELLTKALDCANRAVGLSRGLAEAHATLAAVRQQALDWPGAELSYREALRLKPFFSRAHRWYAGFVVQFGRFDEALEHARIALQQDPYDRMGAATVGMCLILAGKLDEAIQLMEPAVEGQDQEGTRNNLCQAYARKAQAASGADREAWLKKGFEQANRIAAIEARQHQERPHMSDRCFAVLHAVAGNRAEMETRVDRLREDMESGKLSPADVPFAYGILGDASSRSQALDLLERAYAEAPRNLVLIKVNPFFESLRGEARFQKLIRDLRL
jgi:tetratricopeptide (TPR) repeat protein